MNTRKTFFAQIMSLIPRRKFDECVARYNSDYRGRNFSSYDQLFMVMSLALVKKVRPLYAEDSFRLDLDNMVYAFDSSTISLCLKLCPWAKFRKTKAGIKMHTLLDLRDNLPVFIHLTDSSVHDVNVLDHLCVELGAIYLMDKGYVDFFRLFNLIHKQGAFFVKRAKDNIKYKIVDSLKVDQRKSLDCQVLSRDSQNGHL